MTFIFPMIAGFCHFAVLIVNVCDAGTALVEPVTLIMARGPGNGFSDLSTDYHG
jgi:hypothetical protein